MHVGELTSAEDYFLNWGDNPMFSSNKLLIQNFQIALEFRLRLFEVCGRVLILDPKNLLYLVNKHGLSKDLKSRIDRLETQSRSQVCQILNELLHSFSCKKVFGYRYKGQNLFHYIKYPVRLNHVLGLMDALDQACENFSRFSSIKFPKHFSKRVLLNSIKSPPKKVEILQGQLVVRQRFVSHRVKHRTPSILKHLLKEVPFLSKEKDYVKLIKTSLAGLFSEKMEQELPEGYTENHIQLFPSCVEKKLDRLFLRNKDKRVQFYFNILQSKSLCAPVGKDMIDEAYEKHRKSLCRPIEEVIPTPQDLLDGLFEYGKRVGKEVSRLYKPYETSLPNTRSCIESGRRTNGNLGELTVQDTIGQLKSYHGSGLLSMIQDDTQPRMEPYVIGLFGPPGSGKTTLVNYLIEKLRRNFFPGMTRKEVQYSRSCSSEYWDGYKHQPIVVLDDFGQNRENRTDLSEFETLVSLNDIVLPMAHLSEKGREFRSPIIIVTSNMVFGHTPGNSTGGDPLEDHAALWRRFDLPLLVLPPVKKEGKLMKPAIRLQNNDIMDNPRGYRGLSYASGHCTERVKLNAPFNQFGDPQFISNFISDTYSFFDHKDPWCSRNWTRKDKLQAIDIMEHKDSFDKIKKELMEKWDYHKTKFHSCWFQKISQYDISYEKPEGVKWDPKVREMNTDVLPSTKTVGVEFPLSPPPLGPVVKAHAIPEPLKVRMITLGEASTKVLQPFQRALWSYLGTCPQFCLTNGVKDLEDFENETLPWIYRIESKIRSIQESFSGDNRMWLSGDYTAATDNFPMDVTKSLVEGILSQIDHEPTKEWVRWEISPHKIMYPKGKEGQQTSGQLMGSLLSFPLLCFLNDYAVSSSGFEPGSYLVNGDDIVAKVSKDSISNWRELAPKVGLSLSVGKNFIDKDFCTVNSQLFYRGNVRHTGKVATQRRWGTTLSYCFAESQFYWGTSRSNTENFLRRNWRELKTTPRSLHVSKDRGGLGLVDTFSQNGFRVDMSLAKDVYIHDYLNPFSQIIPIKDSPFCAICIPVDPEIGPRFESSTQNFNRFQSFDWTQKDSNFDDLTNKEFNVRRERINKIISSEYSKKLKNMKNSGIYRLQDAPPLKKIGKEYIFVGKEFSEKMRRFSTQEAINILLKYWNDEPVIESDLNGYMDMTSFEAKCKQLDSFFETGELLFSPDSLEKLHPEDILYDEFVNRKLRPVKPVSDEQQFFMNLCLQQEDQGLNDFNSFLDFLS